MRSKEFRVLVEIEGIKYRFNPDAFSEALRIYVSRKRKTDKGYTQHRLILELCELGYSYDAIKNWKQGYNGPGSIDYVKNLAQKLDVDYTSLLVPDEVKEVITEVDNNILKIYQACLQSVYEWAERRCGIKDRRECNCIDDSLVKDLDKVSDQIDMYGLVLTSEVINKLHRIVFDLMEINHGVPRRWEEMFMEGQFINCPDCFYCTHMEYFSFKTKADALTTIKSWEMEPPSFYVADEIDMAVELGLDDINELNDFDEFDELPLEEQLGYGYVGSEIEITPMMIFKYLFRQSLCIVFRHDFNLTVS